MRLPFSLSFPAALGTAAGERSLGTRVAAYRRRRPMRAWAVLVLAAADLTASLVMSLAVGDYDLGIALLAAFPAGLAAYRYAVPSEVIAIYQHGLVHARRGQPRAARWTEIPYLWAQPRALTLRLGEDGEDGTGGTDSADGAQATLTIRNFARLPELAADLDAALQPLALARAQAALRDAGRAQFPPLTVTREGVQVTQRSQGRRAAAWSEIDSYERVGGRLLIGVTQPGTDTLVRWSDAVVANAIAAESLMDETDPTTPPENAAALVSREVSRARVQALRRRRRARARVPVSAVLVTALFAIGLVIVVRSSGGLGVVCQGDGASGTAAYTPGPGPHPVQIEGDSLETEDVLPSDLTPASRADVQLVACISFFETSDLASTCQYVGASAGTPLYYTDYTLTLRAASTGAVVVGPTTVQGSNATCPDEIFATGNQPDAQYSQLDDSQLLSFVDPVAS
jgi:hypothetical protein